MAQNTINSDEVCLEIEKTVQSIQNYDGRSGYVEEEWRKDEQHLVYLMSQNPLIIHKLSNELKEQIKVIVSGYLDWGFNGYW